MECCNRAKSESLTWSGIPISWPCNEFAGFITLRVPLPFRSRDVTGKSFLDYVIRIPFNEWWLLNAKKGVFKIHNPSRISNFVLVIMETKLFHWMTIGLIYSYSYTKHNLSIFWVLHKKVLVLTGTIQQIILFKT